MSYCEPKCSSGQLHNYPILRHTCADYLCLLDSINVNVKATISTNTVSQSFAYVAGEDLIPLQAFLQSYHLRSHPIEHNVFATS